MARKRMVTRSVAMVEAQVMCVNTDTAQVTTECYTVAGKFISEIELTVALQERYQTETFKLVKVMSWENKEVLYGMDESEFIRLAEVLPPRTKESEE